MTATTEAPDTPADDLPETASEHPIVQVHPVALLGDDVIVRDPHQPDRPVCWTITRRRTVDGVPVVDYRDEDGAEGSHGFEDAEEWVTVRARSYSRPFAGLVAA